MVLALEAAAASCGSNLYSKDPPDWAKPYRAASMEGGRCSKVDGEFLCYCAVSWGLIRIGVGFRRGLALGVIQWKEGWAEIGRAHV